MPVSDYRVKAGIATTRSLTPTIATGAYTAKDAVGGLLEFVNVASDRPSGVIQACIIIDEAKQNDITLLHLFNATFTASADEAIFSPSDADLLKYVGFIKLIVADYEELDDNGVGCVRNLNLPYTLIDGGTSLFGQLMTLGTPTYGNAGALTVKLVVIPD